MSDSTTPSDQWHRWQAPTVGKQREQSPGRSAAAEKKDLASKKGGDAHVTASEIESIQEAAYREAYDKGYKEGLESGRQLAEQRAQEMQVLLEALVDPLDALDQTVEKEISDLICIIARQVIRRELRTDPGQIVAVVREAAEALPSSDRQIRVRLHPEDATLIRELSGGGQDARWELLEDPSLTRGGCVVSDRNSRVDASLEQQVGRVLASMLGEEREAPEEPETQNTDTQATGPQASESTGPDNEIVHPEAAAESGSGGTEKNVANEETASSADSVLNDDTEADPAGAQEDSSAEGKGDESER